MKAQDLHHVTLSDTEIKIDDKPLCGVISMKIEAGPCHDTVTMVLDAYANYDGTAKIKRKKESIFARLAHKVRALALSIVNRG